MSNQIRFLMSPTVEDGEKLLNGEAITLPDESTLIMGTNDILLVPEEESDIGGSVPDNMVTTDTEQDITAYKHFATNIDIDDLSAVSIVVDTEFTSGSVGTDDYRLGDGTPIIMPEAVDYEVQLAGKQDIPSTDDFITIPQAELNSTVVPVIHTDKTVSYMELSSLQSGTVDLSNYVDLTSNQDVSGQKNFNILTIYEDLNDKSGSRNTFSNGAMMSYSHGYTGWFSAQSITSNYKGDDEMLTYEFPNTSGTLAVLSDIKYVSLEDTEIQGDSDVLKVVSIPVDAYLHGIGTINGSHWCGGLIFNNTATSPTVTLSSSGQVRLQHFDETTRENLSGVALTDMGVRLFGTVYLQNSDNTVNKIIFPDPDANGDIDLRGANSANGPTYLYKHTTCLRIVDPEGNMPIIQIITNDYTLTDEVYQLEDYLQSHSSNITRCLLYNESADVYGTGLYQYEVESNTITVKGTYFDGTYETGVSFTLDNYDTELTDDPVEISR